MREIKEQFWSIVLRGDFNPRIFQPYWFASNRLIGEEEASNAKVEVIHSDVSHFALDWVDVQVLRDRFAVRTLQGGNEEALRDLVLGTFTLLHHTPCGIIGINKVVHFSVDDLDQWHAIGHTLAPKVGIWDEVLESPGTRSLMIEGKRTDDYRGFISVKVEPSSVIQPGVMIEVNDHIDARDKDVLPPVSKMTRILSDVWPCSVERSASIIAKVMKIK